MTDTEATYCDGIYREGDVRIMDRSGDRRLPIGDDGFERLAPRSVFVDKSMLVADLLNSDYAVTLFCRPRRFGKTLAMTMLKSFFELPPDGVSRAPLFEGLAVWDAKGGRYRAEQGVRPVIYLSLNDVKKGGWEECYQTLEGKMAAEYQRHAYLADSAALSEDERLQFGRVSGKEGEYDDVASSLRQLALYLFKDAHGRRAVILIDEYDAPIMAALQPRVLPPGGVCSTIFQSVVGPGSTGPTRPATPWWETPFARPTARACATSTSCYSRAVWYGGPST